MPTILGTIPFFGVRNIDAAIAFYAERLGFPARHREETFAIVSRDGIDLLLTRFDDESWRRRPNFLEEPVMCGAESFLAGTGACRVRVAGLDELRTELEGRGAVAADAAIVDQWWGDRELHVTDADGNLITFFEAEARQ